MKRFVLLWTLFTITAALVSGGTISLVTARAGATDGLDWSVFGAPLTAVPNGSFATTPGGNTVTVTFGSGGGEVRKQPDSWFGDFSPGDNLLWNRGNGPDVLTFSFPVSLVVFQIQNDYGGAFTSQITAFGGATNLGAFSVSGTSTSNGDGSAAFLGVLDTTAEITSVQIDGISGMFAQDFAINQISLDAIPEPACLILAGAGLAAMALVRRHLAGRLQ